MINLPETVQGTSVYRLTPARCNIWVISRDGRSVIADTGMHSDRHRIKSALEKKGLMPEAVILTHTHFDHAGNAAWFAKEFGAEIIVNSAEAGFLSQGDTPIPKGTLGVTRGLVSIGKKIEPVFRYEPCTADHLFVEQFDLARYGLNAFAIHTPGHSPGQSAVIIDGEYALVGDSLIGVFRGKIFPPFADDTDELLRSWKKLLNTGCHTFLPGHGTAISRGEMEAEYEQRIRASA